MNNYQVIKNCKTQEDLVNFLVSCGLAETLQIEQPIPNWDFWDNWLNSKAENEE